MAVPFTREQLLETFVQYNRAIWPAQLVLFAIGAACILMVLEGRGSSRAIGFALGLVWAWMALAYHVAFFVRVTPGAWVFAGAFMVAASAFAKRAGDGGLVFERPSGLQGVVGVLFALYGVIGYPAVAALSGLADPSIPTLGLPCPTTIFTLGMLLLARRPYPTGAVIVTFVWCVVGTSAALSLGVLPDLALPIAGIVAAALMIRRPRPLQLASDGPP